MLPENALVMKEEIVPKLVKEALTNGTVMRTASSHPSPLTASENGATIEERIRLRVFQLYEQCGFQAGLDLADWLQAERELLAAPKYRPLG